MNHKHFTWEVLPNTVIVSFCGKLYLDIISVLSGIFTEIMKKRKMELNKKYYYYYLAGHSLNPQRSLRIHLFS